MSSLRLLCCFSLLILVNCLNTHESNNNHVKLPDKHINEEIAVGSLISDFSDYLSNQTRSNKQHASTTSPADSYYTFLDDTRSSNENLYFILDSMTGRLTSKRYLDRESLCLNKHCDNHDNCSLSEWCKMSIKVLAIPSYKILNQEIFIQDVNDNRPQFRPETQTKTIDENLPLGHKIPLELAYDPDSNLNAVQTYSLISDSKTFELVYDRADLFLIVKDKIDREEKDEYNLSIRACDLGTTESLCGDLSLVLRVRDLNDNSPQFTKSLYVFSVQENAPIGTLVGQVSALDLDQDLNGKIKYTIMSVSDSSGTSLKTNDYFELDQESGELKLLNPINYEQDQFFSLNIEARDCGLGSMPAYSTIEVLVIDENDNLPEISVNFLQSIRILDEFSVELVENCAQNTFLAYVSLVDRDSNSQLDFKLFENDIENKDETNSYLKVNKLNANSFTLSTSGKLLDRELISILNISILAYEQNNESSKSYFNFSIHLKDENDNAPRFEKTFYVVNVTENNKIDEVLFKFEASDPDFGENAQISYSLEGASKRIVEIDAKTGYLKARKVFDREAEDKYEFFVIARDNSTNLNEQKVTKVKCELRIDDQNDNRPELSFRSLLNSTTQIVSFDNLTVVKIDENLASFTKLLKFSCIDLDSNENGQTKILLIHSNRTRAIFGLSSNMELFVKDSSKLDREAYDSIELSVLCTDNAHSNPLNMSRKFRFELNDLNDNCPQLLGQNLDAIEKVFVNIDEKNATKTLVERVYYDNDQIGPNSDLYFTLLSHQNIFKLNITKSDEKKARFELRLIDEKSFKLGKYVVKFRIEDSGTPKCSRNETLILFIGDKNTQNQQELLNKILMHKNEYFDDKFDEESIANKNSFLIKFLTSREPKFVVTFLVILASLLMLILIIACILICLCKSLTDNMRKSKSFDSIKVRNFSQNDDELTAQNLQLSATNSTQLSRSTNSSSCDSSSTNSAANDSGILILMTSNSPQNSNPSYKNYRGAEANGDEESQCFLSSFQKMAPQKYNPHRQQRPLSSLNNRSINLPNSNYVNLNTPTGSSSSKSNSTSSGCDVMSSSSSSSISNDLNKITTLKTPNRLEASQHAPPKFNTLSRAPHSDATKNEKRIHSKNARINSFRSSIV